MLVASQGVPLLASTGVRVPGCAALIVGCLPGEVESCQLGDEVRLGQEASHWGFEGPQPVLSGDLGHVHQG